QGIQEQHLRGGIEDDVEPGPPVAAEDGQLREQRPLGRPRAEEVPEGAERREVAPGQRAAAAAEPEPLEQHAPDDRLLERGLAQPPVAERAEMGDAHPRGEAAEKDPSEDVGDDLERVEQMDRVGVAPTLERISLAREARPVGERHPRPLEWVIRWNGWLTKGHRSPSGRRLPLFYPTRGPVCAVEAPLRGFEPRFPD